MCGIVGYWTKKTISSEDIYNMSLALSHRGPDDSGIWTDNNGLIIAHRRLSILDLSSAGHQPMESHCGRYVLIFNGEIYNHLDLRKEINKSNSKIYWKGHSDTETLLYAISIWGFKKTLCKLNGMFAIALFDKKDSKLLLARDHLGQKPLYYGYNNNRFLFGSELKAIKNHSSFISEIDRESLSLQFKFNYIPAPKTIYKGIKKLLPGTYLEISLSGIEDTHSPEPFWSFLDVVKHGTRNQFINDEKSIITKLDSILGVSVKSQLISDVPLGAFLSGGIDSSLIVALMQKYSSQPVKTFTIGFKEKNRNEAGFAKQIAKYLGTDHTEVYVNAQDALDTIPILPTLYDEPFSDSSQIPTYLVSKITKRKVKVALSGDGADELFGGYNRHFRTYKWWSRINHIPKFARNSLSKVIDSAPLFFLDSISSENQKGLAHKAQQISKVLSANNTLALYDKFVTHWDDAESIVIKDDGVLDFDIPSVEFLSDVELIMALDTLNYLPNDILTKIDRSSMGVSLETRVPYLDPAVVAFAWKTPLDMKFRNGQGKWVLRQVLQKYLPKELFDRPKMGFGVPLDEWLRGPLRDWAEDLLREDRLIQEGYLRPIPIRKKWNEHISGKKNWQYLLWDILMFQAWLKEQ